MHRQWWARAHRAVASRATLPTMSTTAEESLPYVVVKNSEEQYSIWLADRDPPAGWEAVHGPASRDACLDYVERVWTDMRPKSVREWIAEQRK